MYHLFRYSDSYNADNAGARPSYLYNENSYYTHYILYTGKMICVSSDFNYLLPITYAIRIILFSLTVHIFYCLVFRMFGCIWLSQIRRKLCIPPHGWEYISLHFPDSKVHWANIGPIWGRQNPGGPHVGPMNFVIWVDQIRTPALKLWKSNQNSLGVWFCWHNHYKPC